MGIKRGAKFRSPLLSSLDKPEKKFCVLSFTLTGPSEVCGRRGKRKRGRRVETKVVAS